MKRNVLMAGVLGAVLLSAAIDCHAENWVKNNYQNKTFEATYHDADSVKLEGKTLSWTEKYVLSSEGSKFRTKRLSQYKACKDSFAQKGDVTHYQVDFQIENGKHRRVAIRNYNKANELLCSDQEMGTELDKSWHRIGRKSPMEQTYYYLVTTYKIKDL